MRPPRIAAEYESQDDSDGAAEEASMRPPRIAAEYTASAWVGSISTDGFNEAAANRGGIHMAAIKPTGSIASLQ